MKLKIGQDIGPNLAAVATAKAVRSLEYSKSYLRRTLTGPKDLCALCRCSFYRGYVSFVLHGQFVGNVNTNTSSS